MRVVIDATALGSGLGGDETFLAGMLEGLGAVADPDDEFPLLVRPGAPLPSRIAGDPRFSARELAQGRGVRHFAWRLPRALAGERGRSDLSLSLTHAPLRPPLPYAMVLGDLSFLRHPEMYPRSTRLRMNALAPHQTRRAAAVITFTEHARHDMIDAYGLDPDRVFAVPCRVDDAVPLGEEERARAKSWAAAHGIGCPFILYLGNLHPRKNVPRLVAAYAKAARRSPEVAACRLVVAGARWFGAGGEEEAARLAPEGSVLFTGRVDDHVRRWLLGEATMLAYPSIFEGFGLPPVEAMAAGTPVLAGDRSSMPEVCGDAALLVDPFDVDAIADGVERLVTDPKLSARLVVLGRERAALYTTESTGRRALTALRSAVGPAAAE